jgi:hypothetical protein
METPGGAPREVTFYQDGEVLITDRRAQIGPTMYPLAQITAVQAAELPPQRGAEYGVGCLGVALAIALATVHPLVGLVVGGAVVVLGLVLSLYAKPIRVVRLATAGGQVDAVKDKNHDRVAKIIAALQNAILHRQ